MKKKNKPWSREGKQHKSKKKKKMFSESRLPQGKMAMDSFMGDMNEGHYCLGVGTGGFGGTVE